MLIMIKNRGQALAETNYFDSDLAKEGASDGSLSLPGLNAGVSRGES